MQKKAFQRCNGCTESFVQNLSFWQQFKTRGGPAPDINNFSQGFPAPCFPSYACDK